MSRPFFVGDRGAWAAAGLAVGAVGLLLAAAVALDRFFGAWQLLAFLAPAR